MITSPFKLGWLQCQIANGSCASLNRALTSNGWIRQIPDLWVRPAVPYDKITERIADIRHAVPPAANLRFIWFTDYQIGRAHV